MIYKVGMVSLGCPKNQVDAEIMLEKLRQGGYKLVEDAAMGDIAIINTCGFIESAKAESIEEILEISRLKAEGKIKGVIATGCLAERYRNDVLEEIPELDGVVGIGANDRICEAVERVLAGERVALFGEKDEMPLEGKRVLTNLPYYAYLKIADGCDNCCTYCAIPLIRGRMRSRTMESIIEEAESLARDGIKELVIVAQDTTRYGEDLYGKAALPELLNKLCEIDGVEWIRLLYCYPDRVTDELLDVMASQPKICKYMDIPMQHANGDVLKAMNRRGDAKSLLSLIEHIREKVPGITLRTTMMVGFPGETRKQFMELAEFVRSAKFERLGCFIWSAEEDTPAYDFPDRVSETEAQRRYDIIMNEQSRVVDEWVEKMQGKEIAVITEGFDRLAECCFGRSAADAPDIDGKIFFTTGGRKLTVGDMVTVRITDNMDCDLIGEMI